ncbi:MAG TPA: hypothetical protein VFM15_01540 [Gammaproteobacteria bacterium]|nr:hypothetical protein [Gammaproteobacteria bacterium]
MNIHQGLFSLSLFAVLVMAGTSAPRVRAAPNHSALDRIHVYAGSWKTEIEHYATPYSKAGKETGTLRNACWASGDFYACRQIVNGKSGALLVFTCTRNDGLCHSYVVPVNGDPAHNGKLLIKANVWIFPWQYHHDSKTTFFRVVNTWRSPNLIEYRQEYSPDDVHWTLMARGQTIRQEKR